MFEQRTAAEKVLKALQDHPDAWTRVDTILENSKDSNSKFIALQVCGSACLLSAFVDSSRSGVITDLGGHYQVSMERASIGAEGGDQKLCLQPYY